MLPSSRLIAQLQVATRQFFYSDTGMLIKRVGSGSYDNDNHEIMTEVSVTFPCSFNDTPSTEAWRDFADVDSITAEVRFESGVPEKGDKFKLTDRFGAADFRVLEFEIIGIRKRGAFGWVCALKRVEV